MYIIAPRNRTPTRIRRRLPTLVLAFRLSASLCTQTRSPLLHEQHLTLADGGKKYSTRPIQKKVAERMVSMFADEPQV